MFTVIGFILVVGIGWYAGWANDKDYSRYSDGKQWLLLLHIRQDLKLAAFLLGGIIVMLGIVADRPEGKALHSLLRSLGLE